MHSINMASLYGHLYSVSESYNARADRNNTLKVQKSRLVCATLQSEPLLSCEWKFVPQLCMQALVLLTTAHNACLTPAPTVKQ